MHAPCHSGPPPPPLARAAHAPLIRPRQHTCLRRDTVVVPRCAVLRALGNSEHVGVIDFASPWAEYPVLAGASTRGKFTTTLHLLTSAIKKLSTLQPAACVYFGKASGNLPAALETANELGVRVGVEYGASSRPAGGSTTLRVCPLHTRTCAVTRNATRARAWRAAWRWRVHAEVRLLHTECGVGVGVACAQGSRAPPLTAPRRPSMARTGKAAEGSPLSSRRP